ncbi:MAG: hypothetical protein LUF78_10780 [Clostridiales bacterium]|nr:hypothetical protein [Clostridiales bacterium]
MIVKYYGDELWHSGVKGQKWGEKNGPPYPLSRQKRFGGNGRNKGSGSSVKKTGIVSAVKSRLSGSSTKNSSTSSESDNSTKKKTGIITAAKSRLSKAKNDTESTEKKTEEKKTETKATSSKTKKLSQMSNAEIQAAIDRLNLEQKYAEAVASASGKKNTNTGKTFAQKMGGKLADSFVNAAGTVSQQLATQMLSAAVNKVASSLGADYISINTKYEKKDK